MEKASKHLGSDLIKGAISQLVELQTFEEIVAPALKLVTRSLERLELAKRAAELLGESHPLQSNKTLEEAKAKAEKQEKWALEQAAMGLPYLYGLLSVRVWTILEIFTDDAASVLLEDPASCPGVEILARLKIPFLEFVAGSSHQRTEYLTGELKRLVDASLKLGVGRFEALLDPLGLGGPIDEEVRRTLLELSQLRNAVVHRNGIADQRLIATCPWLGLEMGTRVPFTEGIFLRHALAAKWYICELDRRWCKRSSVEPLPERERAKHEIAELLSRLKKSVEQR